MRRAQAPSRGGANYRSTTSAQQALLSGEGHLGGSSSRANQRSSATSSAATGSPSRAHEPGHREDETSLP